MSDERRTRNMEYHPLERATDKSKFALVNTKIAEYRSIIYLIVGALAWFGWTQKSPGARLNAVEAEVKVVRDSVSEIRKGQVASHASLEILIRLRCFDSTLSGRDMKLAGLDCSDIDAARRAASFKRAP
jgi:hypothetical protein